jgi:hypothetical protein
MAAPNERHGASQTKAKRRAPFDTHRFSATSASVVSISPPRGVLQRRAIARVRVFEADRFFEP